jgi:hypothetical protein
MRNRSEKEYIDLCKRLIEKQYKINPEQGSLRQRDFEYIADIIEERSGVQLSLSTLKRIWKKDYDQIPHPSTLDALVSILGYKTWPEFKLKEAVPVTVPPHKQPKVRLPSLLALSTAAIFLTLSWLIAFRAKKLSEPGLSIRGPVVLTGNKTVSEGVPNTVIFHYDLSHVSADSFAFQQSWNTAEKVAIDPKNHYYSTVYYYPGFHRAKLIANDSVIKQFRVHIVTNGWFPVVRYSFEDSIPIYLRKASSIKDGRLYINQRDIEASGVNASKGYILSYFNVREFGNIFSDNFTLDTRIKMDSSGRQACPSVVVVVMCEANIFYIRLVGRGCEGFASIKMGEVEEDGVRNDLSRFGCDLTQWQQIQLTIENKMAVVTINGEKACSIRFKNDFGKIMGLAYHFNGTAAVDYVSLKDNTRHLVYEDRFGK